MRLQSTFVAGLVALSFTVPVTFAADADKAKKQAEIQKMARDALPEFYKAEPSLKGAVEKAAGYAVFSTFGLSFIIGGAGGKGLAHDNKTKTDTYMHQAQASAGVQAGIAESRTLIVFKSAATLKSFIDSGWDVGAGGGAGAAVQGKGAGGTAGGTFGSDTTVYTLTRTGLQAGFGVAGGKFWKDKELN
jgi:lipid-binding SYLF domain-containing protein